MICYYCHPFFLFHFSFYLFSSFFFLSFFLLLILTFLLLPQFPLPHSRGSSHGQTRIIRLANYAIPPLTPIMADSFAMWKKLETDAGVSLLR